MKLLYLLILCFIFLLQGCRAKPEPDCIPDPVPNDYVEPQHLWMNRHNIGDTLLFNCYHVDTTADGIRKYRYIGQEQYIASDTGTIEIQETNPSTLYPDYYRECNDKINRYTPTINFKGKRKLQVQLKPHGSFDDLIVLFAEKEFRTDNMAYNYTGNFYPTYNIEGKEYNKVNHFTGNNEGYWTSPGDYIDSTYAFYNYDYGILKFIINDTLVLQRVIIE